jgi:outer membrane protein assembly factor BamD
MKRSLALWLVAFGFGCAHGEPDIATLASNSDQLIWEAGQKAAEHRNWESARQAFKRIIDGFPQSTYGPAARLALGDNHFKEGGNANYLLAISEYREFLTLYPSHPRSDYAQFQVAESFFNQRNGPDRDQTPTGKALEEYQRILDLYPASPYVEKARGRVVACRQGLGRSEFLAGLFYQRTRRACRSAIGRYERVLSQYPDYQQLDEVYFRLAQCLVATGRCAEAQPHLAQLRESYPASEFANDARELEARIQRGEETCRAPAPAAPSPSPAAPSPPPIPGDS